MASPNSSQYNANPDRLRDLLATAKLSQNKAAKLLGVSPRMMRYYLADDSIEGSRYIPAPYSIQYAIEVLAQAQVKKEARSKAPKIE